MRSLLEEIDWHVMNDDMTPEEAWQYLSLHFILGYVVCWLVINYTPKY